MSMSRENHDNLDKMDRDEIKHMSDHAKEALNADPITGEPGSHPVSTGLGTVGGAAAGAAIGALGGPLGAIAGGAIGAVVGAVAGHRAGETINPTHEEVYWREHYQATPYYREHNDQLSDLNYDRDYGPAYRLGYESREQYASQKFDDIEQDLQHKWESFKGESRLKWEQAKQATKDAWDRVTPDDDSRLEARNHPAGAGNTARFDDADDVYWRDTYLTMPYYETTLLVLPDVDYDRDYQAAYRLGYEDRPYYSREHRFEDVEPELKLKWEQVKGQSRLKWEQAKQAVKDAWNRATH